MNLQTTPFSQLDAIFKTYPAWLRPTYFGLALSALVLPYLIPAELPFTLQLVLLPLGFLWFMALFSFIWLCIVELVVRTLNKWSASRVPQANHG